MRTRWLLFQKGIVTLHEKTLRTTLRKGAGVWKFGRNMFLLSLTELDVTKMRNLLSQKVTSYVLVKTDRGYFRQYPMDRLEQFFNEEEKKKNRERMDEACERFEIEGRSLHSPKYTDRDRKRLERMDDNCGNMMDVNVDNTL
jgi:hypothetical protein